MNDCLRSLLHLFLLVLWAIILCLGVLLYALGSPSVAHQIGKQLSSSENGLKVTVEHVTPVFFPLPGLRLSGLVVRFVPLQQHSSMREISVCADSCLIRPAWIDLLRGNPRPNFIGLVRPSILINTEKGTFSSPQQPSPDAAQTDAIPENLFSLNAFSGMKIRLTDGELKLGEVLRMTGVSAEAALPVFADFSGKETLPVSVSLHMRLASWSPKAGLSHKETDRSEEGVFSSRVLPQITLHDVHMDVEKKIFLPPYDAPKFKAEGRSGILSDLLHHAELRASLDIASLFSSQNMETQAGTSQNAPCRLRCTARFEAGVQGPTIKGEISLHGDLPFKNHPVSTMLQVPFTFEPLVQDPTASLSGALTEALHTALPDQAPTSTDPGFRADPKQGTAGNPGKPQKMKRDQTGTSTEDLQPVVPVVRIDNARLDLDGNVIAFTGRLLPGRTAAFLPAFAGVSSAPHLEGRLEIQHLSLPRWFGFARQLPDGVQAALDQIDGSASFTARSGFLSFTAIELAAAGMTFTGTASVLNPASPEIRLKASCPEINLNRLFPELHGQKSTVPEYTMPPLVEHKKTQSNHTSSNINFDIELAGKRILIGKWSGQNVTLRTVSLKNTKPSAFRVDCNLSSFHKGSIETSFISGKDTKVFINIRNVDSESLVTRLHGKPVMGGILTAKAELHSDATLGTTITDVIKKLHVSFTATLKKGFWTDAVYQPPTKKKQSSLSPVSGRHSITRFSTSFQGMAFPLPKQADILSMNGNWRLEMEMPDWQADLYLDGPITLSDKKGFSVSAEKLRARLLTILFKYMTNVSGNISFESSSRTFSFSEMTGTAGRMGMPTAIPASISGQLKIAEHTSDKRSRPVVSGELKIDVPKLRPFLTGPFPPESLHNLPDNAFSRLHLKTSFDFSEQKLRITHLDGRLDDTLFSASLSGTLSPDGTPQWDTDIRADTLDISRYIPSSGKRNSQQNEEGRQRQEQEFASFLQYMHRLNIRGHIHINQLSLYKIQHDNFVMPFILKQGIFTADPVTAQIFGGKMGLGFQLEARSFSSQRGTPTAPETIFTEASARLRYTLTGMDIPAFCRARQIRSPISGRASFEADIKGIINNPDTIAKALNGTCSFRVSKGNIYSSAAPAKPQKAATPLSLSGTGFLHQGVLSNNNLLFTGNGISARGYGTVNFVKRTLDYYLNISLPGVTDIPIHYFGSLDQPQRSINTARAITGTLTSIGGGVLNLLETVVSIPFRLIRP